MNFLFDLDGTLTDSRPGIVACIKHALLELGAAPPADEDMPSFIGPPLRDTFALLLRAELDAECVTAAIEAYRRRFTASGMFENSVYPGIPAMLDALTARGARLHVATSKPRVFAERILDHFGLAARFDAIYGSELDGRLCDKRELIAHALERSALRPSETVMIGDRRHDIEGALHNDVSPAGVLWGYGSEEELRASGAKSLLAAPEEVLRLVS